MSTNNPFGGSNANAGSVVENHFQASAFQERILPPVWPMAVAGVTTLVSILICISPMRLSSDFGTRTYDWLALLGYLFTPLLVVFCLACLRSIDLKMRSNPYFDVVISNRNLKILSSLTALAFVIGSWHIFTFAKTWGLQ